MSNHAHCNKQLQCQCYTQQECHCSKGNCLMFSWSSNVRIQLSQIPTDTVCELVGSESLSWLPPLPYERVRHLTSRFLLRDQAATHFLVSCRRPESQCHQLPSFWRDTSTSVVTGVSGDTPESISSKIHQQDTEPAASDDDWDCLVRQIRLEMGLSSVAAATSDLVLAVQRHLGHQKRWSAACCL